MKVQRTSLQVDQLEECVRVNVRAKVNADVVRDYAEAYQASAILPPLIVYQERACERYIVADGRHRLAAAKRIGLKAVDVELREGDETDALKFALQCNSEHGLRRNKADLICAVGQLMANKKLSDEYRTHPERAELLRISPASFQRYLADWRSSKGGNKAEQAAKREAQESAAKHTARPAVRDTAPKTLPSAPEPEVPPKSAVRTGPKREPKPELTAEQKKAATQVRESHARQRQPAPQISAASVMDYQRMIACSRSLPPAEDFRAGAGPKINWDDVERLHAWLGELLENR